MYIRDRIIKRGLIMFYRSEYISPLGKMILASDGINLTGLWLDGQKYICRGLSKNAEEKSLSVFDETKRWLGIYFDGKEPDFQPPLSFDDTPFRINIWNLLLKIPYGETVSYKFLADEAAKLTGKKACAQAVGGAVGHNPISVIVPCHRVVGMDGSLTGYAGGTERKLELLKLEKTDFSKLKLTKQSD